MKSYDVIIVGAGPAGASLGYRLKAAGLSCLIVDKAVFPRDKLCGGLLTQKAVELMETLYSQPFACYEATVDKVRIYDKKGRERQRVVLSRPFYLVDRVRFDSWLLEKYKDQGGETAEGIPVSRIDQKASEVYLKDGTRFGYQYLVGADGANSLVRRYVDSGYRPGGFCLEINPRQRNRDGAISLFVGIVNRGYGWIFPKGSYMAVGLGGELKKNRDIGAKFRIFRKKLSLEADREKAKGAFVPYGTYVKTPARGNILLIGDAAGLVEPLTGEGIYFALLSGHYAAESIRKDSCPASGYIKRVKGIQRWIRQSELVKKIFFLDFVCFIGMGILHLDRRLTCFVLEHVVGMGDTTYWKVLPDYIRERIGGRLDEG